ncbi:SpdD-like protein [Streptomyces marispadix]|uniref:SpdD-like protein n=1 Tax=Streptomyces marispadix TaxID=2922868 RepID=A0ABS9SZ01_9ACTN|nr:SpdD-like protein [Streptomyces marispadix]MCH6161428.1 SpdD-like protein [Streptomyces marispadix]
MFRPKYPTTPVPTAPASPTVVTSNDVHRTYETAPVSLPAAPRRTVQLTPGAVAAVVGGGAAVALIIAAVLVALLLAVAVTAVSVTMCAVVLRSLLNSQHKRY